MKHPLLLLLLPLFCGGVYLGGRLGAAASNYRLTTTSVAGRRSMRHGRLVVMSAAYALAVGVCFVIAVL